MELWSGSSVMRLARNQTLRWSALAIMWIKPHRMKIRGDSRSCVYSSHLS